MSDDQNRGRRRPSREYHSSEASSSSRRPREPSYTEEPRPKIYKRERDSTEDRSRLSSVKRETRDSPEGHSRSSSQKREYDERRDRRDERPSTSQAAFREAAPPVASRAGGEQRGGADQRGGGDQRGGADQRRDRNNRYEVALVHTKPSDVTSKVGVQGTRVVLQTNYFRLKTTPTWRLYQYHVSFSPTIELKRLKSGILSEHRSKLGGYLYDGTKLFTTIKLREEQTILHTKSRQGENYVITIKYVGLISMTEWQSLQILNLILRRSMEGLKLQLVGRNFYDPIAKIDIREHHMQLWPGYQTSIRQHEKDILLCAEIAHKVMRTETVYDIFKRCFDRSSGDFREDFKRHVIGLTVLTDYNNKTYRINDIDFQKTPKETFSMKGESVSFLDYYYKRYNLRIKDPGQPLLLSKSKERSVRGGEKEVVILIPELCRATGLDDSMRNNFRLMRALADHTRMNPDRRIDRLKIFNRRLQQTEDSVKILNEWNMQLDDRLVEVEGRILDQQKIVFRDHRKEPSGEQADWTRHCRIGMFTTPSRGLNRWCVIATSRNARELRNFVESLLRAANGMQMQMDRPREVIIYDDRTHSYIQAMEDCCRQDPQLIMCLVPNNMAERYASIKKKSCLERSVPTQVITQKSASNPKGLMSIATKVAIQINCKLGYTPWMIDIPLKGLMTIGYDVAKSSRDRSKAFGALVATMDLKSNATFYSTVAECSSHDVLANSLWPMMTKALRQYKKEHDALPNRILFYRDGVSEGSLKQLYEHEVKDIVEKLEQEYKRAKAEKPPMFAYVVVTKSINTRLFARGHNPPPGTVVDDVVTLPERYDFYLVSQSVRQGTVSPTSYNVVYSTIRLTPDQMQLLTYKMTHLYYNWSGTTRVPAVCQYAKKLATLVGSSLFQPPQNALEKKLYYL
ncbi:protein piwi [Lucilia sericata]|uniref:protein piwi n=1 Tax=Lucilia sericata TaxID=13632 RepID=UPI0018A7E886|nr:protein piwi [Lucilia sericata]